MSFEFDMDKVRSTIEKGTGKAIKAVNGAKETVRTKYEEVKTAGELDDLYCELGRLVNEAYNAPGTVDEASVCALNDKINAKREELREIKK